jgi:RNA polymerase sigma-70 factor (ECF subfamily)
MGEGGDLEPTDRDLCACVVAGDRDAFATLYQRNYAAIWRLVSAYGMSADATPDLVHETFVRALDALRRGRQPERFALWLRTIAVNLVRDRWRRTGARREYPVEPGAQPDRAAPAADADDAVAVRQALTELATELREVVVLHFYQGLTPTRRDAAR